MVNYWWGKCVVVVMFNEGMSNVVFWGDFDEFSVSGCFGGGRGKVWGVNGGFFFIGVEYRGWDGVVNDLFGICYFDGFGDVL